MHVVVVVNHRRLWCSGGARAKESGDDRGRDNAAMDSVQQYNDDVDDDDDTNSCWLAQTVRRMAVL